MATPTKSLRVAMRLLLRHRRLIVATAVPAAAAATVAVCDAAPPSPLSRFVTTNGKMAAAMSEIRTELGRLGAPGWERLVESYGGCQELILRGHLTMSVDKKSGAANPSVAHESILRTILFREEHDLNRADVEQPIEAARCRSFR